MAFNQSARLFMPKRWQHATVVQWLKRMHAWTGFWGAALFLLLYTIAGALITMSLTGFLLWTRLHGSRLLVGAIGGGALICAAAATAPFFV